MWSSGGDLMLFRELSDDNGHGAWRRSRLLGPWGVFICSKVISIVE